MLKIFKSKNGFTLMETIAVLVVLGILAVIVINRTTNMNMEVYTGADSLKMHLRYAQTLAMNSTPNTGAADAATFWGIKSDGSNSYWLFKGINPGDNTSYVRLPDDPSYINNDRTINLTAKKINVSSFTVLFDNRGIPYSPDSNTKLAPLQISVTPKDGGTASVTINITPLTGYIP